MLRLVHVIPTEVDFQSQRAVEMLRSQLGREFDQTVVTVGRRGTYRDWATCAWCLRSEFDSDVLHAWGTRALTVAALAGRRHVVFSPIDFPDRKSRSWLRSVHHYRPFEMICPSATMRRTVVENGFPIDACHLIRPGVEFARIKRRRDATLRKALGFADTDLVMLACGESTQASAHRSAVWAAAILHKLDRKYRILLWGRGQSAPAAAQLASHLQEPDMLSIAEQRLGRKVDFEELIPATDAVFVTATDPIPTLPVCIAMAAGLPIISIASPTASELLEDRHTALMLSRAQPRELAQRVLDLMRDPQLQWTISDMARTEAYEYFSMTRFVGQHREVYRQIAAEKKVDLAEPTAGAGLRFHGRA